MIVFGFLITPLSYKGSRLCEFDQQQTSSSIQPFIHSSHKDTRHRASAMGKIVPGTGTHIWQASVGGKCLQQTTDQLHKRSDTGRLKVTWRGEQGYQHSCSCSSGSTHTGSRTVCRGCVYLLALFSLLILDHGYPFKRLCQELHSFSLGLEKCTTLISCTWSQSLLQIPV